MNEEIQCPICSKSYVKDGWHVCVRMNPSLESLVENTTLRDQFAMAALTGICACGPTSSGSPNAFYADRAYKIADAMLEARKGKE